jgi:Uma2 family endonuclease
MATTTKLVTYEKWLQMPEIQDAIEEVVNGEIRIMPPPKLKHARVIQSLRRILDRQLDSETFELFDVQFGLVIRRDPLTSREPDLAVFRKSTMVEIDGYVHSAPELAVEVLSPSNDRRERMEKLLDYESIGVPEVWVLSPEARTIEVMLLEDEKLLTRSLLREGQLRPKLFPEVVVDVASVWPD